eukprot:360254-Lingulodinium_polyedra.AAC.1
MRQHAPQRPSPSLGTAGIAANTLSLSGPSNSGAAPGGSNPTAAAAARGRANATPRKRQSSRRRS